MTKYIIKDVKEGLYYGGEFGWWSMVTMAETFDTKQDAKRFVCNEDDGWYKIEEVYIVES